MSEDLDYESLLEMSVDDIPSIKLLPTGSWKLRATNATFRLPTNPGDNAQVLIVYRVVEPMDNVDDEALAALGPDYNYSENRVFSRFWIETKGDLDKVREHVKLHGVDPSGMTVKQMLAAARGREVIAMLQERQFQDRGGMTQRENTASAFEAIEA